MAQLRRMWSGQPGRGRRAPLGRAAGDARAVDGVQPAQRRIRLQLRVRGRCARRLRRAAPADDIRVYQPSTRPGAPLPHAWIEDEDGHRRPVKDLLAPGRFLLIAPGEDGQAWCQAARHLAAETGVPLDPVRSRPPRRRLPRPALRLAAPPADRQRRRESSFRPDRFIAWRHPAGTSQPRAVLAAALSQILARPAGSGGQSGTASASFSATSIRSACRHASSSSCKALAMAASCSLATFTLASAGRPRPARPPPGPLRPSPGSLPPPGSLRPSRATRAWDVCSRPSPGFGASTSAPAWPWTMRLLLSEPPSASALTPVTRAARGAARRPLQIEVHRLRLPSGRLGLSVPVSQGP